MSDLELTLRAIELSKLRLFYEIAKEKHLTRAAEKLNLTQPAVSKALQNMENRLQMKLFQRVPNGMRLTTEGEILYLYAKEILERHELFQRGFLEKKGEISGNLEIIVFPFAGVELFVPMLKDFFDLHPKLNAIIRTELEDINPIYADVSIGSFIPNQPDLIQKKLLDVYTQFYASNSYLKKFGVPQTASDLDYHNIIDYKNINYSSPLRSNIITTVGRNSRIPRRARFLIDSLHGMVKATLCGYGISELPNFPSITNSGLEVVLPEIKGENIPLHFIFHKSRENSKKIKILYNYIAKRLDI